MAVHNNFTTSTCTFTKWILDIGSLLFEEQIPILSTVYIEALLLSCMNMLTKHSHTNTQIQIYIANGHPHGKDWPKTRCLHAYTQMHTHSLMLREKYIISDLRPLERIEERHHWPLLFRDHLWKHSTIAVPLLFTHSMMHPSKYIFLAFFPLTTTIHLIVPIH